MFQRAGRFTSKNRLNRPVQYQKVFRSPCRSADDYLLVIARKNNIDHSRLGLAISRKRVKKATTRNKLKRIIRESFRLNKNLLTGLDIVVITHKPLREIDTRKIAESIRRHWQRLIKCENL